MKRLSILLIIGIIALMLLSACGAPAENDEPQESEAVASESIENTDASVDTSYEIETVGDEYKNDNGETIADIHFQKVVFSNPNEALAEINDEINEACEKFFNEGMGRDNKEYFDALPDEAKAELAQMPYVSTYDVEDVYIDDNYVSITYNWAWFAGGVSNYGNEGFTFDIKTGEDIDFVDLFASEADARAAFENAVNALIDENPESFFEDAKDTVASYDLDDVKFSIDANNITVFISQYDIAPGASGAFTVEIAR